MENYNNYFYSEDGYFTLNAMNLSEETQKELIQEASNIMYETYKEIFSGHNFKEIQPLFKGEKTKSDLVMENLKEEYNDMLYWVSMSEGELARKMEVDYMNAQTEYYIIDRRLNVEVYLDFLACYEELYYGNNDYASAVLLRLEVQLLFQLHSCPYYLFLLIHL
ncbi:MAG: hypothetical protein GX829_11465 [Clostridium sp.]|nr:hypothetical protein [Clostridium sp.]